MGEVFIHLLKIVEKGLKFVRYGGELAGELGLPGAFALQQVGAWRQPIWALKGVRHLGTRPQEELSVHGCIVHLFHALAIVKFCGKLLREVHPGRVWEVAAQVGRVRSYFVFYFAGRKLAQRPSDRRQLAKEISRLIYTTHELFLPPYSGHRIVSSCAGLLSSAISLSKQCREDQP